MPNSLVVRDHMTPLPYGVQRSAVLSSVRHCFEAWGVDRIPIFVGDAFCGVMYERDFNVARELGLSLDEVLVGQVPLHDAHVASADAPLSRAARAMALQQVDTTVVQEGARCVGLLLLERAVSALADESTPTLASEANIAPSKVRDIILVEHENIRRLLQQVEQVCQRVLSVPVPHLDDLHEVQRSTRRLCAVMQAHVELEDWLLAPTLESLDAWGKVRAERLRAEHAEQTLLLDRYLSSLNGQSSEQAAAALAAKAQRLVDDLRKDMQTEEQSLLRPDLLCDDPTAVVVEAG